MRTVLTSPKQSNLDVKRAAILFPKPAPRQLKCGQFHAYKLRTAPAFVDDMDCTYLNQHDQENETLTRICDRLQSIAQT
eukprot:6413075-Ditylum_brightwellii.AAC.1